MAFKKKKKASMVSFFFLLLDTLTFDQYMLFFQNFSMDFHWHGIQL